MAACGQVTPGGYVPCDLWRECQANNLSCFSCNAGYVCGDDGKGDVTCLQKDIFGKGPWGVLANSCPDGQNRSYHGGSYTMCYNTKHQAQLDGCSHIEDNCH